MPFTISEFAQRIKAKYPSYQSIPDQELYEKIVAKYPEYEDDVIIPTAPLELGPPPIEAPTFQPTAPATTAIQEPSLVGVDVSPREVTPQEVFEQAEPVPTEQVTFDEPTEITPLGERISLEEVGTAFDVGFTGMLSAGTQYFAQKLQDPTAIIGAGEEAALDPAQKSMYDRGQELAESGVKMKDLDSADKLALTFYNSRVTADVMHEDFAEKGAELEKIADNLRESITEEANMTVEEARQWFQTEAALNPRNAPKTFAAAAMVSAEQGVNTMLSLTPVGIPTMVAMEGGNWIQQAKESGVDDPETLKKFADIYAIPSAVAEMGMQAVLTAPIRKLMKGPGGKAIAKTAANATKKTTMRLLAEEFGKTVGAAAFEGLEEMTQEQMSDVVTWMALKSLEDKFPEKAEQYKAARDQIDLNPLAREKINSFIIGAVAGAGIRTTTGVAAKAVKETQKVLEKPAELLPTPEKPVEKPKKALEKPEKPVEPVAKPVPKDPEKVAEKLQVRPKDVSRETVPEKPVEAPEPTPEIKQPKVPDVELAPTEPQKEAGNYKKRHIRRDGFEVSIENPAGSFRSGTDKDGETWSQEMNQDYGYMRGTTGYDKDHLDVFINPKSEEGGSVFIVNQVDPKTKKFDEHKVMMGFTNEKEALQAYNSNYEKGWKGAGSIVEMPMEQFKEWARSTAPSKGAVSEGVVRPDIVEELPTLEEVRGKVAKGQSVALKQVTKDVMGKLSEGRKGSFDIEIASEFVKDGETYKLGEGVYQDLRGAFVRDDKTGRGKLYISPSVKPENVAEAVYHEFGHFVESEVKHLPVHKSMEKIYRGWRTGKEYLDLAEVYLPDLEAKSVEEIKPNTRDDVLLFKEFVAHKLSDYLEKQSKKGVSRRVYEAVKNFLLDKVKVKKGDVDATMRAMLKEMKKDAKQDPGTDIAVLHARRLFEPPKTVGKGEKQRYVGTPDWVTDKRSLGKMRRWLEELAVEGEPSKMWYENSSKAILELTGGNKEDAEKIVQLVAITSPQRPVAQNMVDAVQAYTAYKNQLNAGVKPENIQIPKIGAFPTAIGQKARELLIENKQWEGRKTNNFYINLMREIDPATAEGQKTTQDVWMVRAFGYTAAKEAPTEAQYDFMERETRSIAKKLGWEPHQAQAAIWTAIKNRYDNHIKPMVRADFIKKGLMVQTKTGLKPINPIKYNEALTKAARMFKDPKEIKNFDFETALGEMEATMSWEATPGKATTHMTGIHEAPFEQRLEYHKAIQDAMTDANGQNIVLKKTGLLESDQYEVPGVWKNEINPVTQFNLPVGKRGKEGKGAEKKLPRITPESREALTDAAAIMGLFTRQEGVGFHKAFPNQTLKDSNSIYFTLGKKPTSEQMQQLDQEMSNLTDPNNYALLAKEDGVLVLGFPQWSEVNNKDFREMAKTAATNVVDFDAKAEYLYTDSELVYNDWKEHPDGQDYRRRLTEGRSPDLLDWSRRVLYPKIREVETQFAEKYGWDQAEPLFQRKKKEVAPEPEVADKPLFKRAEPEPEPVAQPAEDPSGGQAAVSIPLETKLGWLNRKVVDKYSRLKDIQKYVPPTNDDTDTYLSQELLPGRVESKIRRFDRDHVQPMMKGIKQSGLKLEEVEDYLYARHAKERNAYIESINPDIGPSGSGMSNQEADDIMNRFESEGKIKKLEVIAGMVDDVNSRARAQLLDAGLINEETKEAWEQFENYVPLRGINEYGDPEYEKAYNQALKQFQGDIGKAEAFLDEKGIKPDIQVVAPSKKTFARTGAAGVKGPEAQRALGRRSRARNIIAHTILQMNDAIMRSEKNAVNQTFLDYVEANPDVMVRLPGKTENVKLWEVDTPQMKRVLDPNTGMVTQQAVEPKFGDDKESVLIVKRDGQEHQIKINDPILARAMTNLGVEKTTKLDQVARAVSRHVGLINTQLNPEFALTNLTRDVQTAMINVTGIKELDNTEVLKTVKGIVKDVFPAMAGSYKSLRGDNRSNMAKWFREFEQVGGRTGFFNLTEVDEVQKKLIKSIDRLEPTKMNTLKNVASNTADFISNVNDAVESSTRVAVYKAMREKGMTKKQSASIAKSITVNFNRKGEIGAKLNAWYVFANASIQGTRGVAMALKSKRAQALAGAITAGSIALAQMNRFVGGEGDDGEDNWDKIPDWVKETNIVIMTGPDKYIKIPVPYGYNIFHALGVAIDNGVHNRELGKAFATVLGATMNSFNPLGSAPTFLQTVTPTAGRLPMDLGLNKNFIGQDIVPEKKGFGVEKAPAFKHKASTPELWKGAAETFNKMTFGSTYQPGLAGKYEPSPDQLDYIFEYVTGGAGKTLERTAHLLVAPFTKKPVATRNIPFVRRFWGEIEDYGDLQKMYERMDKLEATRAQFKHLQMTDPKEAVKYAKKHSLELAATKNNDAYARKIRQNIKKLKMQKRILHKHGKVEEAERLEEAIKKNVTAFNKIYLQLKKKGR